MSGNGRDAELEDVGRIDGAYSFSDSSSSSTSKVGLFLLLLKIQPESRGGVMGKTKPENTTTTNPGDETKVFITIS